MDLVRWYFLLDKTPLQSDDVPIKQIGLPIGLHASMTGPDHYFAYVTQYASAALTTGSAGM
jgi:hypothetical protein